MVRIFPFRAISVRPARIASAVIYFTSLTRIPVAQIVSISSARRSRPKLWAVSISRIYSCLLSCFSVLRNNLRWILRYLVRQSFRPKNEKNLLSADSFPLMVTGLRPACRRYPLHSPIRSLLISRSFSHMKKSFTSREYLSMVAVSRSSSRKYLENSLICSTVDVRYSILQTSNLSFNGSIISSLSFWAIFRFAYSQNRNLFFLPNRFIYSTENDMITSVSRI